MEITWGDISTHLVYCKLTGEEPNTLFKDIHDYVKKAIPIPLLPDETVVICGMKSYRYDSLRNEFNYNHNIGMILFRLGIYQSINLIHDYLKSNDYIFSKIYGVYYDSL
jgi:hypothetical protein